MQNDLIISMSLYFVGLFLIFLEIVTPGMIMGFTGIACTIAGIVFGFRFDLLVGISEFVAAAVIIPFTIIYALNRFKLNQTAKPEMIKQGLLNDLIGKNATACTDLKPLGMIEINGTKLNASSFGDFITKGTSVKVAKIQDEKLFVKSE